MRSGRITFVLPYENINLTIKMELHKALTCTTCKSKVPIHDVKFPEDMYDLIQKYNVKELIWLCNNCELEKDKITYLHVRNELTKVKIELQNLHQLIMNICIRDDSIAETTDYSFGATNHPGPLSPPTLSSVGVFSQPSSMERKTSQELSVLKDVIVSKITINQDLQKQNKEIIESFCDAIIPAMKSTSDLFKTLYQRTYRTGSSYEGLRISDPNEYDIDIVLKLPFKSDVRQISPVNTTSGFASCRLCGSWNTLSYHNPYLHLASSFGEIERSFIEDGYIMPAKVRSWIQSIVDKVQVSQLRVKHVYQISPSQSGPAKTFKLYSRFRGVQYEISVDLVPVILFSLSEFPESHSRLVNITTVVNVFNVPEYSRFWFMVPKEYKGSHCRNDSVEARRLWRIHFPEFEKYIIHNRGCVKPVIKLMKLLRDRQQWHVLSSYSLKTVVLSRVFENPNAQHWSESNMSLRLIEALEKLSKYLDGRKVPHIFFDDNLLQSVQLCSFINVNNRLKNIIVDLKLNFAKGVQTHF